MKKLMTVLVCLVMLLLSSCLILGWLGANFGEGQSNYRASTSSRRTVDPTTTTARNKDNDSEQQDTTENLEPSTTAQVEDARAAASTRSVPGQRFLRVKGGKDVPIAASKAALDRLHKLSAARDYQGIDQMIARGEIASVPSGTPALRISGVISCEVRILAGEYEGKAVWVPGDFLKPK